MSRKLTRIKKQMRIPVIEFKAGPTRKGEKQRIEPGCVTIFVGPNHSGKSLALRELHYWLNGVDKEFTVLSGVSMSLPGQPEDLFLLAKEFEVPPPQNRSISDESIWFRRPLITEQIEGISDKGEINFRTLKNWLNSRENESSDKALRNAIVSLYTLRLNAQTRFDLTKPKTRDNPNEPQNHLARLLFDEKRRKLVRTICHEAFPNMYLSFNILTGNQIRLTMSKKKPRLFHELSIGPKAKSFHDVATQIDEVGDGVRSLVGIILAIIALNHRFVLIDDPEAFLHPPVAYKLGYQIAQLAETHGMQLFISTHSAELVSGCIEASSDVTLVRLTYDSLTEVATANVVDRQTFGALTRHPLIRSARPIGAMFHRAAVLVEGGDDRVIYSEINHRLQELKDPEGSRDTLFLSAHGSKRIPHVLAPLRKMGIPTVAILDIDTILETGGLWNRFVTDCGISEDLESRREEIRIDLKPYTRTKPLRRIFKTRGLSYINECDEGLGRRTREILDQFRNCGIFLVHEGCLESWFPEITDTENWIDTWFETYGSTIDDPNYKMPEGKGVWNFIRDISGWIAINQ
ncbi:MAG: ATP-dependent nuclease [Candidatus Thorarchaeota archaeon]